jgi:hypothetical protein
MSRMGPEFVGFFPLEGTLAFLVPTENTSDVPTNADSAPTYTIYSVDSDSADSLATGTTSNLETGIYRVSDTVPASEGFVAGGFYDMLVTYAMSVAPRKKLYRFGVV